ncbi:MAG: tetratricopeptide repeat protein [Planctomycetota bacterium]
METPSSANSPEPSPIDLKIEALLTRPEVREVRKKPNQLYAVLKRIEDSTLDDDERRLCNEMRNDLRFFATPISAAPGMYTLNGVGTSLYGASDKRRDGTYIATLFFVILFLPIIPIARYIVRPAGGRSYNFYAKVPMWGFLGMWRRFFLLGILLVAGSIAAVAFIAGRTGTIHIVNGLPVPVWVTVGESPALQVAAGGRKSMTFNRGPNTIVAHVDSETGREIEHLDNVALSGRSATVYNVLGAAPLYLEHARYFKSTPTNDQENDGELLIGPAHTIIQLDGVEYLFVNAPKTLSVKRSKYDTSNQIAVREELNLLPGTTGENALANSLGVLRHEGLNDVASKLLINVVHALPTNESVVNMGVGFALLGNDTGLSSQVMRAAIDAGNKSMQMHRTYQQFLLSAGKRDELLDFYRGLSAAEPESGDMYYLRTRVEQPDAAADLYAEGVIRFPDNAWVLRGAAWLEAVRGHFEECIRMYDQLAKADPDMAAELVDVRASALVAVGRNADAYALLADTADRLAKDGRADATVAISAWSLLRQDATAGADRNAPEQMMQKMAGEESRDNEQWLIYRIVTSDQPVSLTGVMKDDTDARKALEFLQMMLRTPQQAISRAISTDNGVFGQLPYRELLVMLAIEAHETDSDAAARKLLAAAMRMMEKDDIEALDAFCMEGKTDNPQLGWLDLSMQAAVSWGRARRATSRAEDDKWVAQLKLQSPIGPIRRAMELWPK